MIMAIKIENKLDEILQKYWCEDADGYYSQYRESEDDNAVIEIIPEISEFLASVGVPYSADYTDAFENCGYECGVLSITWFYNGTVHLKTILCEEY